MATTDRVTTQELERARTLLRVARRYRDSASDHRARAVLDEEEAQHMTVQALRLGATGVEASHVLGVSRQTLWRWQQLQEERDRAKPPVI